MGGNALGSYNFNFQPRTNALNTSDSSKSVRAATVLPECATGK